MVDNFNEFADLMIEIIFPKVSDKFKDEEDRKLWNYIQETNCIDYRKVNVLKKIIFFIKFSTNFRHQIFNSPNTFAMLASTMQNKE